MKAFLTFLSLALFSFSVLADEGPTFTNKNGIAINGYDTVAYFTQDAAVPGSDTFKTDWNHATWLFSSQENLDLFTANPEKYAPQYGGYCAYAVAKDSFAKIDPTQFTVLDGKLYLNYNARINRKWGKNRDQFIIDANDNWPGLLEEAQGNVSG